MEVGGRGLKWSTPSASSQSGTRGKADVGFPLVSRTEALESTGMISDRLVMIMMPVRYSEIAMFRVIDIDPQIRQGEV